MAAPLLQLGVPSHAKLIVKLPESTGLELVDRLGDPRRRTAFIWYEMTETCPGHFVSDRKYLPTRDNLLYRFRRFRRHGWSRISCHQGVAGEGKRPSYQMAIRPFT
jgi:hypothetical protein